MADQRLAVLVIVGDNGRTERAQRVRMAQRTGDNGTEMLNRPV